MDFVDNESKRNSIYEDYRIGTELGRGNFSVVKEATHRETRQKYAVKIMEKKSNRTMLDLIQSEIEILKLLKGNSYIIGLKDIYEDSVHLNIVMELIGGGELFDKIVQKQFYSEKDGSKIISTILKAVQFCHSKHIVHRDLKPENLLCGSKDLNNLTDIKLADFGFAKVLRHGQKAQQNLGTTSYKAPEIFLNKPHGFAVDMWAVGVISFIILGGYQPFDKHDPNLEKNIIRANFEFHKEEWSEVGSVAKDFISKLLVADPEQRMNVEQAIKHPFITDEEVSSSTIFSESNLNRLRTWNAERKFKSVAVAILTSNKLKSLFNSSRLSTTGLKIREGITLHIVSESLKQNTKKLTLVNDVQKMSLDSPSIEIKDLPHAYVANSIHLHSLEDESVQLMSQRHNSSVISEAITTWNIQSEKKGTQLVEIYYETDNLYWCATYTAVITRDNLITLTGHYNIINNCGKSFVLPQVYLVDEQSQFLLKPQEILPQLVDGDQVRIHFLEKTEIPVIKKKLIRLSPHHKVVESTLFVKKVQGTGYGTAKNVLAVDDQQKDSSFLRKLPLGTVFIYQVINTKRQESLGRSTIFFSSNSIEFFLGEDSAIRAHRIQTSYNANTASNQVTEVIQIIVQNKHDKEVEVVVEETLFRWPDASVTSRVNFTQCGPCVLFTVKVNPQSQQTFSYTATYKID